MLTPEGRLPPAGETLRCLVFDDLAAARAYCEGLVQRREDLRCDLYDHHGLARRPLAIIVHPKRQPRQHGRKTARWLNALAFALFLGSFPLFWWDARHSLLLIFPTLIGTNFLLIAVRLVVAAHAMRVEEDARREAAARHDDVKKGDAPS